jgi:hypothetical protein
VLAEARLRLARQRAAARRASVPLVYVEHAALAVALAAGWGLMRGHGWSIGHPRWLGVKLLLVTFLVVPLEAMHAWASYAWIRGGPGSFGPGSAARFRRGLALEEMIRTLEAVLLGLGVPIAAWLSWARPF